MSAFSIAEVLDGIFQESASRIPRRSVVFCQDSVNAFQMEGYRDRPKQNQQYFAK